MTSSIVRVGTIGAGRAGLIHARNFTGYVRHASLCAVADPNQNALAAAHEQVGEFLEFADYRDLLAADVVDAVVVTTPTVTHREIVVAAARHGKHVLCEKPMAMNVEECATMIEACREAGVILQIGFMRRFDAGFRTAKQKIDAGEIGEVVMVRSLTHGPSKPHEWMLDVEKSNGPLAEVSSHDIDTLRWFTASELVEVYAIAGNYRCRYAAEAFPVFYDNIVLTGRLSSGAQGVVEGAVHVRYGYDARVEVLGTEGIIFVGGMNAERVSVITKNQELVVDAVPSWRTLFLDAYRDEDQSFIDCVLSGAQPRVRGIDGLRAVEVVNAGNRSIVERKPVSIQHLGGNW